MRRLNFGEEKSTQQLFFRMESFCLRTPADPSSSRTVVPFFNIHKHLFWHVFWLESIEQARVRTQVCGIPLPEAELLGSVTTAAQASRFTLPVTFTQTWTFPLPQSEEQFPFMLLGPETHLSKYHKSCQSEQDY